MAIQFILPWLKNGTSPYVSSNHNNLNHDLKVANLIDHNIGDWKNELAKTNFNQQDAQWIKDILVLNTSNNGKLIWWFSPTGKYIVYNSNHNIIDNIVNHDYLKVNGDWMLIWKLVVPQNNKTFSLETYEALPSNKNKLAL